MPTLSWKQGTWDSASALYLLSDSLFSFSRKKRPLLFRPLFQARPRLLVALPLCEKQQSKKASSYMSHYELRCRECGRSWGNQPRSICDDCFSPLEVAYDYDAVRAQISQGTFTKERIAQRPPNMWRYSELLPLPQGYEPRLPVGFTPLFQAPRLAEQLSGTTAAAGNLYIKNDAVCMPTLSFKDRVVAVALSQAKAFGFDTVSLLVHRKPGQCCRRARRARGIEGLDLYPFRPRACEDSGNERFRREGGAHRRQLRPGQPPLLADR